MQDLPDFGTYHHTTIEQSEDIRKELQKAFRKAFTNIKEKGAVNNILDAGCGLGILCAVSANYFPNASVLGVDLFGSESLPMGSVELAKRNMEVEGIASKVRLLKFDLKTVNLNENEFDLIVSNLVFHNLGESRFDAYKNILKYLKPDGHFIFGDLFSGTKDKYFLIKLLKIEDEITGIKDMPNNYSILIKKK
jgi:cyclopropane fatty-acyl-phospholipid synthase-like methyltransferase